MSANKTQPTAQEPAALLAAIEDPQRRADGQALAAMMERVVGAPAVMWGASIIGFGSYHYRYDSGREGDWAVAGFAPRGKEISVYLAAEAPWQPELLARLGRHRMGKACLYIRRLADVDIGVLEQLVAGSVAEIRQRYG